MSLLVLLPPPLRLLYPILSVCLSVTRVINSTICQKSSGKTDCLRKMSFGADKILRVQWILNMSFIIWITYFIYCIPLCCGNRIHGTAITRNVTSLPFGRWRHRKRVSLAEVCAPPSVSLYLLHMYIMQMS